MDPRQFLERHLKPSRLIPAEALTRVCGGPVFFKMESELPTGSFKVRGAMYALALNLQRREVREVTAASTGNHGAAVAYAARKLGVRARIFLPENANLVKRRRIAALGAQVVESGRDLSAAIECAAEYSRQDGIFMLDDASDPDLPAGPATIGSELLEQEPTIRVIYVPVGDSALIRGIASAVKSVRPDIRIVGVQAEQAPSYYLSWKQGQSVSTETCETIADGLATRRPLVANVEAIRELVDDMVLVSEQQILGALKFLLVDEHIVAEPAGAAATAAVLAQAAEGFETPAAVLITGANISEEVMRAAVSYQGSAFSSNPPRV